MYKVTPAINKGIKRGSIQMMAKTQNQNQPYDCPSLNGDSSMDG
jgi:hypothetical protein